MLSHIPLGINIKWKILEWCSKFRACWQFLHELEYNYVYLIDKRKGGRGGNLRISMLRVSDDHDVEGEIDSQMFILPKLYEEQVKGHKLHMGCSSLCHLIYEESPSDSGP